MQRPFLVAPGDDLHTGHGGAERSVGADVGARGEDEPVAAGPMQRALQGRVDDGRLGLLIGRLLRRPREFRKNLQR